MSSSRPPNYADGVDRRRALPAVDHVLAALQGLPHELLVTCAREAVGDARDRMTRGEDVSPEGIVDDARRCVDRMRARLLRPVINATGVILHTNLGRAPLGDEVINAGRAIGSGYSN